MESGKQKPLPDCSLRRDTPFKPMFKRVGPGNRVGEGLVEWPVEEILTTKPIQKIDPEPFPWGQAIVAAAIIAVLCYFFPWYYVIPGILFFCFAMLLFGLFAIASFLNGF
jgi:hypothetical protein